MVEFIVRLLHQFGKVWQPARRFPCHEGRQRHQHRISDKRWLCYWPLLLCSWFLFGFGPPKLVDREIAPTRRVSVGELQQWASSTQTPDISATSYLLYDVDADRVLYERRSRTPLPPASLTKLMTALLVLEAGDLQASVTIRSEDLIGNAGMGLQAGEAVTVEELLWGLLIASGNDAAMALARYYGGTVEGFVEQMNRRALELGLSETRFANPHGLDAEEHHSSAADMLDLTRLVLAFPLAQEIVATDTATVSGHPLRNTNELLGIYPGANGVKTGTTDAAGECLVLRIERDGRAVILVLLGSNDRYGDARRLHGLYLDQYAWMSGDEHGLSALNRLTDGDGKHIYLSATGDPPDALVHKWSQPSVAAYRRVHPTSLLLLQPGLEVGVLEWRVGDTPIGSQPLVVR